MHKINVQYLFDNSVISIILNSPKGNVLDSQMMTEIGSVLDSLTSNKNIKLIIFGNEGKHFSFGASVEEHKKENASAMLKQFNGIFYSLIDLGIPSLAKVTGFCLGGAMELAIMCNFIFADESAVFGQPEINLGVFPPPASLILPLKIGYSRAEDILLTGRNINAAEAKSLGIVNHIFKDKNEMEEYYGKWVVENIINKSASSLRFAVKSERLFFNQILKTQLPELEKIYISQLMETSDANEGIISFLEKRKPVWRNS